MTMTSIPKSKHEPEDGVYRVWLDPPDMSVYVVATSHDEAAKRVLQWWENQPQEEAANPQAPWQATVARTYSVGVLPKAAPAEMASELRPCAIVGDLPGYEAL